jgi:glyoxylase-like metal-dependent hydrolase (beta-lactamase superfamily II)
LILTHWHFDHAGSAEAVAALAPGATLYAGGPDIPMLMAGSPDFGVPPLRRTVKSVADGDEVFGLRVIATPGHTLGHISLLEPVGSTLFAGDAVFNLQGVLTGSVPAFTADLVQAGKSVQKLAGLGFQRLNVAHGLAITDGAAAALGQFLERYPRASDGQSLEHQSFATQASFAALHGAQAGAEWVRQHEAELRRGGGRQMEESPYACCPYELMA